MCVNNLPRVALDSGVAWIRTRDLLIASLAPYLLRHQATKKTVEKLNYIKPVLYSVRLLRYFAVGISQFTPSLIFVSQNAGFDLVLRECFRRSHNPTLPCELVVMMQLYVATTGAVVKS